MDEWKWKIGIFCRNKAYTRKLDVKKHMREFSSATIVNKIAGPQRQEIKNLNRHAVMELSHDG